MNIFQSQIEGRVCEIVQQHLASLGYELVRVKLMGGAKYKTLQIMIDRLDGEMLTIEDCEIASRQVSVLLDVEDPMDARYSLEMSSPGLNRPLTREKDLLESIGQRVKLSTKLPVEGQKNFSGKLLSFANSIVVIQQDDSVLKEIQVANINEANLQFQFEERKVNKNKLQKKKGAM